MKDKIINMIKKHTDSFGVVFSEDKFDDCDFLNISEEIEVILINGNKQDLIFYLYDIEDDYDMNVSTDTLDELAYKLITLK